MSSLNRFFALACVITLVGCSGKFVSQDSMSDDYQASRYSIKQDTAPDVKLSADQIALTTPRKEPISKHGNKSPYTVNGKSYRIMASAEGYREQGIASWYGAKFHGHSTSNGEIFDMNKISAAHKTLPLPTWVKVTNLDNGKSINVRVNDRGPFHGGRIIDLSYAAAVKLDYQSSGTAKVLVEVLTGNELDTSTYFVQVGAFSEKASATAVKKQIETQVDSKVGVYKDKYYRVRIGPVKYDQAVTLQQQFTGSVYGKPLIVAKP
jgi:rare lipoprotein A